jgi:hypothetical protein
MTPLKFLNSLPLARLVVDSDQRSRDSLAQDVLGGNYRLLNELQRNACLTLPAPLYRAPYRSLVPNLLGGPVRFLELTTICTKYAHVHVRLKTFFKFSHRSRLSRKHLPSQ